VTGILAPPLFINIFLKNHGREGWEMPSNTCRICKKPLTDFTSVRLGIGPVCRARDGLNMELELIPHADFSVQIVTDNFIYIKDVGDNSKSITNDAEWVLQKLAVDCGGLKKRRIFYMDTMGQIDEIAYDGKGRFIGFKPGHKGVTL
jgi:hypothetical protein